MTTTQPTPPGVHYDTRHVSAYDSKIRGLIPGYDVLHELSAQVLATQLPAYAHVLVAGCGTGEELLRYRGVSPAWRLSGFDPAGAMISVARERVATLSGESPVELFHGDIDAVPEMQADAATALLVSHFIADNGPRAHFWQGLAQRVRPGGCVLMSELMGQRDDADFQLQMQVWRKQQDAVSDRPDRVEQDFARLADSVYPLSEGRWYALMESVGLRPRLCFWRSLALQGWLLERI
ncbi:class I SAM-dependent methyltransferase [Burkholderiaceae bacterium DAT-1]|nr:class I SAM-dependent methyltransferase [Burkholderiaceae bacterium DAT-1]